MTDTASSTEVSAYNRAAIDTAAKIAELRAQRPLSDRTGQPLPSLLPKGGDHAAVGAYREWMAMGQRPVSVDLESRAAALGITFEHLGLTIGTVLHGADLPGLVLGGAASPGGTELIAAIRATLLERKVIFFRDQHLTEDEQVAFGRCFGELDAFPFGKPGDDNPFILEIVHGETSPGTENGWHTDVTWMEQPSLGSIAQCVEVPPTGGDTLFADSHAALLGLSDNLRMQIDELHGINDYRFFIRRVPEDLVEQVKDQIPFGVPHPLVRTHPETGKDALYLHGGFLRHDSLHNPTTGETLDADESRRIVYALLQQHAKPEYQCRFQWSEGSIAFWDNRAVQHYAASDYYPHARRLRRVTVSGDRPTRRR